MERLSYEYIRGLVEGEGTFTFSPSIRRPKNGTIKRVIVPAFAIKMHERDEKLLKMVRDTLGLSNKVYNYDTKKLRLDGGKQGRQVMLIVREFPQIKNIIIPFFYGKLQGNKGKQFLEWLEKMGGNNVSPKTNLLYRLHKNTDYFIKMAKKWN